MGFDQGRIVLDSDNGSYFSGQTVHGKLSFDLDKVKTFRGIYAKIKGYCKVHWTSQHSRRVPDGRGGHRTEHYTQTHESHEVYIDRKTFLVGGESGEHHLNAGKHEFPFTFHLPDNCPSSFEGEYGHIRYEIKVVVDRAFKFDQEKKVVLRVFAPLDLNANPYCSEPIQLEFQDSYCCCCISSGACETFVKLPKGGYCPGQTMPIEVRCENKGNVEIETISFAIEQLIEYRATNVPGCKSAEDTVAKLKKGPVPGNTTRTWLVEMEVPSLDIYNVNACQYIDIDYVFKVKVSPEGCHDDSKEHRRLIIGNIPLRGYQDDVPNPLQAQMPKQTSQTLGLVVTQPMPQPIPNISPYPYPNANMPYPGSPHPNPPPPGIVAPYPASPYPGHAQPASPYPGHAQPAPPYPGHAQPASPYPPPYPGTGPAVPTLPPGANVPYPVAPASPYGNASAPMPATPDSVNDKNIMEGASTPYNPHFKG